MTMGWRVFYSYSHKDAELRERLGTYLAPLAHQKKIAEWHDRKIEPGADWETEINSHLESANLILLLVSADFLASEYCFGVEVEKALIRLKRGEAKVVPVLLKPCLWKESPFSELQIIPRDARAITSWASPEEALNDVAAEISKLVSTSPPSPPEPEPHKAHGFQSSLDLVRHQVRSYARLYERTRQRMRPSDERTRRMEQIFEKMRLLATASYPLLDELSGSPSPGERLAAVAILQVFATEQYLPFLVKLVGSEKPFVGYHAVRALHFAVGSADPHVYPQLLEGIHEAQALLDSAAVGFDADRQAVLRAAEEELRATIEALSVDSARFD
jgi:TIR domain/HEAT repeats